MRVLFLGEIPETADYDDPAIPAGLTPEKVHAGIAKAEADMASHGWERVTCLVPPDPVEASARVRRALASGPFDCAIVGGGLRLPASRVAIFEVIVNLLRVEAPGCELAFNTSPETSAEAVLRRVAA